MHSSDALYKMLIVGAGLFTIIGAAMDWDWFMNNSRAKLFVWLFGRNGARVFYIGLGLFIIIMGTILL
jgi:hypothetical protein